MAGSAVGHGFDVPDDLVLDGQVALGALDLVCGNVRRMDEIRVPVLVEPGALEVALVAVLARHGAVPDDHLAVALIAGVVPVVDDGVIEARGRRRDQLGLLVAIRAGGGLDVLLALLEMADGALFYFRRDFDYDEKAVAKFLNPEVAGLYKLIIDKLTSITDFSNTVIEQAFKDICEGKGLKLGQIAPQTRIALCGGTAAPGIYEVMDVLGKEETCRRLARAKEFVENK